MARLTGGIFSNPSGSTGGITFGAARTRQGKVVTARQKVSPSNPDTPAQQVQRTKFSEALAITKAIGPTYYQNDWNRAVSQLPGFQSLQSIMLRNLDAVQDLTLPADVPLGDLTGPVDLLVVTGGAAGEIDVTYNNAAGPGYTQNDAIIMISIPVAALDRVTVAAEVDQTTRAAGAEGINGLVAGADYIVGVYARGSGIAEGKLSIVQWFEVTAGA